MSENLVIPESGLPSRTLTVCPDGYLIINDRGMDTMSLFELDSETRAALIEALQAQGGEVECESPEPRRFEARQVDGVQLWTVWDVRADAPSDVDQRVYTSLAQANRSTARLNTLVEV